MSDPIDFIIRPATEQDLEATYEIQYESDADDHNFLLLPGIGLHSKFQYELDHSRFLVAEAGDGLLGFGALFEREGIAFLATLFVRTEAQQRGRRVGTRLLEKLLSAEAHTLSVVSSANPRALAIYIRAGMLPRWPLYLLEAQSDALRIPPETTVNVIEADVDEPALLSWDEAIAGRGKRVEDQRYWIDERSAVPVWFQRRGERIGYGYVQMLFKSSDAAWFPDAIQIGPVGVHRPDEMIACLFAAISWASQRAPRILIDLPGPNPAIGALLHQGFQIDYVAIFCSSSANEYFDPGCYIVADTITF